ncbi:efflux RND transporter periplasmic adaptor subunit [Parasedimentitalea maritima]|uniref:Efflux RND transporter periplasmic adaptor subunit n=1 Tax=Parasedimentitalea maritima TaxID=2578117 RepID=A0A6A4RAW8_9RHOB|nr:efflux RND transporter periplasmic adaptor subunit [Zongyanglinia marina]KAE9625991.1 efflux RND transporter periplasmic adaptor subunit [Zongyanglinia marina]
MRLMTPLSAVLAATLMAAPVMSVAEALPKPVKLMTTETGEAHLERQFFGQVAAKQTVDLAFQVSGQILKFPVAEGIIVPTGALIAELDLEQFELKLEQARLQKEQADRTVTRMAKLEGTVSKVASDDAITQAGLAAIAVRDAEYALRQATMKAPFDALVSSREVALFTTVNAGTPIVRMHDMSELHIEVDVPEILFQKSEEGDVLEITATFPGRDDEFPLQILEFDAEASNVGQTYKVTFLFEPPKDMQVFPGASTTVKVVADAGEDIISLPATALVSNPSGQVGAMVFSPKGADEGRVTWTPVDIEPTQFGNFRVLSGLQGGEEIVLTGGGALTDGQSVRRFTGFAN